MSISVRLLSIYQNKNTANCIYPALVYQYGIFLAQIDNLSTMATYEKSLFIRTN